MNGKMEHLSKGAVKMTSSFCFMEIIVVLKSEDILCNIECNI